LKYLKQKYFAQSIEQKWWFCRCKTRKIYSRKCTSVLG